MSKTPEEIFEFIKDYSFETQTHPDDIAKIYSGMKDVEKVMFTWMRDMRKAARK